MSFKETETGRAYRKYFTFWVNKQTGIERHVGIIGSRFGLINNKGRQMWEREEMSGWQMGRMKDMALIWHFKQEPDPISASRAPAKSATNKSEHSRPKKMANDWCIMTASCKLAFGDVPHCSSWFEWHLLTQNVLMVIGDYSKATLRRNSQLVGRFTTNTLQETRSISSWLSHASSDGHSNHK